MWHKFLCWLLGHRQVAKAYTGEKMEVVAPLGNQYTVPLYKWQRFPFCLRCGKELKL